MISPMLRWSNQAPYHAVIELYRLYPKKIQIHYANNMVTIVPKKYRLAQRLPQRFYLTMNSSRLVTQHNAILMHRPHH